MNDIQFNQLMAQLRIIALNTTVIAAQVLKKEPLTDDEIDECRTEAERTAQMIQNEALQ